jgi:hypothetical protein
LKVGGAPASGLAKRRRLAQHDHQPRFELIAGKSLLKTGVDQQRDQMAVLIATHSQSSRRTRISLWLVIDGKVWA